MNSSFPNRWSFSYLKFTKYVTKTGLSPTVFLYWPFQGGTSVVVPVTCSCCPYLYFGSAITSLNRLPIWNSQNCSMFSLAFVAGLLQGHWWGFISRNYVVWPIFLLMNVFIALKGSHLWFLFDFTAAGVVPCGGRKTSPRTSTIVQFIFYFGPLRSTIIFWEIRNKWLIQTHILNRFLFIWTQFWFISVFESTAYLKFAKLQYVFSGFRCRVIAGSLMRLY